MVHDCAVHANDWDEEKFLFGSDAKRFYPCPFGVCDLQEKESLYTPLSGEESIFILEELSKRCIENVIFQPLLQMAYIPGRLRCLRNFFH
ncbi:hypothetical protein TNCV_633541 [Trichonephila clavipes]|nr:hypothetical protein TNCV_633541 [Trichonephila clavipes]